MFKLRKQTRNRVKPKPPQTDQRIRYRGFRFVNFRYVVLTLIAVIIQYIVTHYTNIDLSFSNFRHVLFENKAVSTTRTTEKAMQPEDQSTMTTTTITTAAATITNDNNNQEKTCSANDKNCIHNIDECSSNRSLLPFSSFTTNCLEIQASSMYQGKERHNHRWSYEIIMTNHGSDTLQMVARHWIFTNINGITNEIKAPGANGQTPILRPGKTWSYKASVLLPTSQGSMSGSFQMEVLQFGETTSHSNSDSKSKSICTAATTLFPKNINFFSASVQRLSLTGFDIDTPIVVPCSDPTQNHWVPTTSVHTTQRIVVGATCEYIKAQSDPAINHYIFKYQVQINNVKTRPVRMESYLWNIERLSNENMGSNVPLIADTLNGVGLGGLRDIGRTTILPGKAFRYTGYFTINAPRSMIHGKFLTSILGGEVGNRNVNEKIDVLIGRLGCNVNGRPIDPILYDN